MKKAIKIVINIVLVAAIIAMLYTAGFCAFMAYSAAWVLHSWRIGREFVTSFWTFDGAIIGLILCVLIIAACVFGIVMIIKRWIKKKKKCS